MPDALFYVLWWAILALTVATAAYAILRRVPASVATAFGEFDPQAARMGWVRGFLWAQMLVLVAAASALALGAAGCVGEAIGIAGAALVCYWVTLYKALTTVGVPLLMWPAGEMSHWDYAAYQVRTLPMALRRWWALCRRRRRDTALFVASCAVFYGLVAALAVTVIFLAAGTAEGRGPGG
jgi:hypothetical protein